MLRLVGWVAGPERAVLTLEGRAGRWGQELATAGAAEVDRALAHTDVDQVTDKLLALAGAEVVTAG